jgi:Fur family ferric uptake transcriptional regulator
MKINFSQTLIYHKLKVTDARKFLLEAVAKEKTPVDAQSLIELMQKELQVDRVTVFRILNTLTAHGILRKLEFQEGKARYELNNEDHHHLICENCGKIEDIPDTIIPEIEKELGGKHSFLIKRHSLEFFGLCNDCQKKASKTS